MKSLIPYILLLFLYFNCDFEKAWILTDHPDLNLINGTLFLRNTSFDGHLVDYYDEDSLKSLTVFKNGRKNGVEKHWNANGTLAVERYYRNGIKVGRHRGRYLNGQLQFEYFFNDEGRYHGSNKEWYATGQLARDFNFVNGHEVGLQRLWKINGNIRANYEVRNGERFGLIGLKKCNTLTVNRQTLE
ncbi:toxin-antitoxin system YwqK family antitoxin [Spongiimicrobium salis]|uniref:toxin-antitoxin system YwqK family antitoxin n=1 Tax=Spongiimicrobium salis TaxID=1667022 RepID=UPI00374DF806